MYDQRQRSFHLCPHIHFKSSKLSISHNALHNSFIMATHESYFTEILHNYNQTLVSVICQECHHRLFYFLDLILDDLILNAHGILHLSSLLIVSLIYTAEWTVFWQNLRLKLKIWLMQHLLTTISTRGWALDKVNNSRCILWPCDIDLWPNINWVSETHDGLSLLQVWWF